MNSKDKETVTYDSIDHAYKMFFIRRGMKVPPVAACWIHITAEDRKWMDTYL